jgi:hypothetical protein
MSKTGMKGTDVAHFEKVNAQLEGVYDEITSLSKKFPNDTVNKFKLRLANKILENANLILGNKYKPFDDFTVFDDDTLPSNSDVAFILNQYLSCMENLRAENIKESDFGDDWYWMIDGKRSSDKTAPPRKLNRR